MEGSVTLERTWCEWVCLVSSWGPRVPLVATGVGTRTCRSNNDGGDVQQSTVLNGPDERMSAISSAGV